jgi:hypothetical protein
LWIARVTASITSARSGDASLAVGWSVVVTSAPGPTCSCRVLRTSSIATPGKMRQLMFAVADCGSAFFAWPPRSMVATHVVRVRPICEVSLVRRSTADSSRGFAAKSVIALPSSPGATLPSARNSASVVSFHIVGKRYACTFFSASASW